MKDICVFYLDTWYSYGFGPLNWFVCGATDWTGQYGTWGVTDNMAFPNTPKLQAIDQVRSSPTPPILYGYNIPGAVNATWFSGAGNYGIENPYLRYIGTNSSFDYLVRAPRSDTYNMIVFTAAVTNGTSLDILVNNDAVGTIYPPNSGPNYDNFVPCSPFGLQLNEGFNVIRLFVPTNRPYDIQQLVFQYGTTIIN